MDRRYQDILRVAVRVFSNGAKFHEQVVISIVGGTLVYVEKFMLVSYPE